MVRVAIGLVLILVIGAPAAVKRELSPEAIDQQRCHARRYAQLAASHAQIRS